MEFVEFIRTPMVDGVTLYRPNNMPVEGTLCVTGHHLILSSRKDNKEELWVNCLTCKRFGIGSQALARKARKSLLLLHHMFNGMFIA